MVLHSNNKWSLIPILFDKEIIKLNLVPIMIAQCSQIDKVNI